jgi:hypothetical protein
MDYTNFEIKNYDDLISKTNSITQCTEGKSPRDFGIDFGPLLDFCVEVANVKNCLNMGDMEGEGLDPAQVSILNDVLDSLTLSQRNKTDRAFEAWNSAPAVASAVCSIISKIMPYLDGVSAAVGSGSSNIYNIIMEAAKKIPESALFTELAMAIGTTIMEMICGQFDNMIDCMISRLESIPWDCLSMVDSQHLEALRNFDAGVMCIGMTEAFFKGLVGNTVGANITLIRAQGLALKQSIKSVVNASMIKADGVVVQGSLITLGQMSYSSCNDIAKLVDTVVNQSALGAVVAISQVIYRDFNFLNELDAGKLAQDLFDCVDFEFDELCDILASVVGLSDIMSGFTSNMLTALDKFCELTDRLNDKLNSESCECTRSLLEYNDDRLSPLRNSNSTLTLMFILDIDDNLTESNYAQFLDWLGKLDLPDCVDFEALLTDLLPYAKLKNSNESSLKRMIDVYYEHMKCVYAPDIYNTVIHHVTDEIALFLPTLNVVEEC